MGGSLVSQFVEVLAKIDLAGGTIVVRDQEVRLRLRAGTLTDQDRAILREHRDDILAMFRSGDGDETYPDSGETGVSSPSPAKDGGFVTSEPADQNEPPVEDLDR